MDDATRASRGAAAGGGASVVSQHSARSHQSNRSIPAVVGGGNSVHQSIIGTGNYFDDTVQRSRRVVAARKIVCPKDTRGLQGSRDYSRQHAAATAALPDLFGAAKHFRTKNAEGELAYKYKDIQSEYVGNLDKLKLYRKHLEAFNMLSLFYNPELIDPHAFSVNDRWGDRMTGCVDLTKHWSQISLEHACAWQRDTFDWCCDENDLTSMEWAKEFLTNSCDINLVKRIEEKYDYLAEYEQGGITYLKIALDEMFTMSNMVIQSLQKYLKQFAQEGIAKVPNEDVRLCSEQINAVCARLAEVDQLPQESTTFILEGFTRCSVVEFKDIHKLLATTKKVCQMRVQTGRRDSSATLAAVNKLCSEACEVFHSLNLTNKWNIPQGHRTDAFIPVSCFNCVSPDHTADVCPIPRDEAKIKKAKEARDKAVRESRGGRGGGCGGGRGRGGRGGVRAVIAPIPGTYGVPMVTPNLPIKSPLMESRRGTGHG